MAIPKELTARAQWVCWRREQDGDSKPTKVPYRAADPGRKASSTDPSSWSTYEQALAVVEQERADGVGFVFTAADDIIGIDLDHCRDLETGVILPAAQKIIDAFYTDADVSQSGSGVHIYLRGKMPAEAKHKKQLDGFEVEVYEADRYFCVTGQQLGEVAEVHDCQDALNTLCAQLWPTQAPGEQPPRALPAVRLDDGELVAKMLAAKNGPAIAALYQGDVSAYDDDDSAADAAFLCHLAWWANSDAAQMDRTFRRSGLYREKWERADYRDASIAFAIEKNGGSGYSGSGGATAHKEDKTPPQHGPDLVADAAHAEVLRNAWLGSWRWADHESSWRHWTGRVWERVADAEVAAEAFTVLRAAYATRLATIADPAKQKPIFALLTNACHISSVNGGLAFLKGAAGVFTRVEEWDADKWTLNCADGILDLRTQTLSPPDP
ncbi:MAG: hypothetical protein ACLQUT_06325, partial [Thermoleophilia bacterium]